MRGLLIKNMKNKIKNTIFFYLQLELEGSRTRHCYSQVDSWQGRQWRKEADIVHQVCSPRKKEQLEQGQGHCMRVEAAGGEFI